MRAIGVHVAVRDGRYIAGFAVVEDATLVTSISFAAPSDEDEAAQLHELHRRAGDLIDHHRPDLLALRVAEIRGGGTRAAVAHRGEGAILGAAGKERDLPVSTWVRASLVRPSGLDRAARSTEITDALCATLDRAPAESEARQAAAAAVAALGDA